MVVNTIENPHKIVQLHDMRLLYSPRPMILFHTAFEHFSSNEKMVKYRGKFDSHKVHESQSIEEIIVVVSSCFSMQMELFSALISG
jgi:hypothetical protein